MPVAPEKYDRSTIAYHWATALLVFGLWIMGKTADVFPKGPLRDAYWSTHYLLGLTLIVVFALRVVWRFTGGRRLPDAGVGLVNWASKAVHHLLYLLIAVALGLGLYAALVRGASLYGVIAFPEIGPTEMRRPSHEWHELAANVVFFLALAHAAAALWHQFGLRDGLLQRMRP